MPETDAITAAIQGSMVEAGLGETTSGGTFVETGADYAAPVDAATTTDDTAGADGDGAAAAAAAVSPSAGTTKEPVVEPPVETADQKADRETLEALGLKAPKPGEKENRLPHSRVSQMVLKAVARGKDEVTKTLQPKLDAAEARSAEYARLEVMADRDPDRLIELFAAANPKVWKPVQARLAGAATAVSPTGQQPPTEAAKGGTPMPEPNFKLPDGSMTYDQRGLIALLEWNRNEATAAAEAKFEQRLTPFEKARKDAEERDRQAAWQAERAPRVRAQIESARKQWGALFDADYDKAEKGGKSDILTYMNENRVSFDAACAAVLLPKLRVDRTTMRKELLEEINSRKEGVTEPRVSTSAVTKSGDPITDAIIASMAAAGLK